MDELLTTKGDTEYGQHGGNHASCYSSDTATLGKVIEHQSMFPLILSVRIIEGKTLQLRGKKKITYQDGRTTTTTTKKNTHKKKRASQDVYVCTYHYCKYDCRVHAEPSWPGAQERGNQCKYHVHNEYPGPWARERDSRQCQWRNRLFHHNCGLQQI